jgi:hypothetical protein
MVDEITMDEQRGKISLSVWLQQRAQGNWPDALRDAAKVGNDDTLAAFIQQAQMLVDRIQKQKPKGGYTFARLPHNAHQVLAEIEFNNYFCRGLSQYAIQSGIERLQVYRAKAVAQPRPESESKIGLLVDPNIILTDLRASVGFETALGIPPGPGTGITLRIPKD